MLGDQLVGCGRVGDEQCAAHAEGRGRRRGHPQILADFHAEREAAAVKHEILPDGDTLSAEDDRIGRGMARLEPAALIEFAAVGQMLLRNDAENAPAADGNGTVIQPSADFKRKPDDKRGTNRRGKKHMKRLPAPVKQRRMNQQIAASIATQTKLRKNAEIGVLFVGGLQHMRNFPRVIHRGREVNARHGGHRANHTENRGHSNNSFRKRE